MSDNSIPSLGFAVNVPAGEKAALPVAPSDLVYSHFKHINGVPAPAGSHGVTISKLNILDILIDQMSQINKTKNPVTGPDPASGEGGLDALINSYMTQIKQSKDANAVMPYITAASAETGSLFNLLI